MAIHIFENFTPRNYGIVKKAMLDCLLDLLIIPPSVVEDDVIPLYPYGLKRSSSK